jgi:hypothetical protein
LAPVSWSFLVLQALTRWVWQQTSPLVGHVPSGIGPIAASSSRTHPVTHEAFLNCVQGFFFPSAARVIRP